MAEETIRTRTTSRTSRTCARPGNVAAATLPQLITLLAVSSLLTTATASESCGGQFDYPDSSNLKFYYSDTINITYHSNIADPQLLLYCYPESPERHILPAPPPFNASTLFHVNTTATAQCWFTLQSSSAACAVNSTTFLLSVNQRSDGNPSTLSLEPASPTSTSAIALGAAAAETTTSSAPTSTSSAAVAVTPVDNSSLSPGVKAGLGISISGAIIAICAMVAFFYFRRRRRIQDANLAGTILEHDRRSGRKGPEKGQPRTGAESVSSGRSEEPLNPVQPVFDGFPGSMGYDDVRSLHSSTHLHSPTWPQSPSSSHHGAFFPPPSERSTEIEELEAARLQSSATLPAVVSYGPNRVTPTLTPRPSDVNVRAASISIDSREGIPPMPDIPLSSSYATYEPGPPPPIQPRQTPSPPKKTIPLVVSYGPNRVTPTPPIKSSIPPPDDAVMRNITDWAMMDAAAYNTQVPQQQHHHHQQTEHQELDTDPRRFSFDCADERYSSMGPLPPYASTADFYAMEKGAIRKMAEPQAQAELPPTKDGYYHDRVDVQEYELPGAAPQNEPQLPFNPFRNQPQGGLGIDEQKFLLDDAEMAHLREQKRRIRAQQAAEAAAAAGITGEAYEMTSTGHSRSVAGPS